LFRHPNDPSNLQIGTQGKFMTRSLRTIGISLFLTVLALSLNPSLRAQTTLDQQKRTARIYASGALENTTPWISTVVHTSGSGEYVVVFSSPFNASPNCVVTPEIVTGQYYTFAAIIAPATTPQPLTTVTINTFRPNPLGLGVQNADAPFRIYCMPDQIIATSAATWDSAANLTSNPNSWISFINHLGPGSYQAVFATPYTSAPTCTATPTFPSFTNTGATADIVVTATSITVSTQGFTTAGISTGPQDIGVFITCVGAQ
jgi:hypothetical protein